MSGFTKAEFETTIGDDDIDVTVEFGYCEDSDERGSFVETELYKVYITADVSKTDIQCLLINRNWITDDEIMEEAFKAAEGQRESDLEDKASHRRDCDEEEFFHPND